jgi:hypothetical protein
MRELFSEFETNREPRARRMAIALAATCALHLTLAAAIIYVPALRSALEIASLFRNADYTNEDYDPTRVGERAQIIKLNDDKFQYPAGYFALLKSNFKIEEAKPAEVKPTPKPTPKPKPTPDASTQTAKNSKGNVANEGQAKGDSPAKPEDAEKIAEQAKVKKFLRINAKPFRDLLKEAAAKKDKGELDLSGTIQMTIEADRNEDGTLVNVVVTSSSGNPALKDIAKRTVSALSDSHALAVLEDAHHLKMFVRADQKTINVRAVTRVVSADRAAEMAKGYGALILVARLTRPPDEALIYKNTSVTSSGDEVTVKFEISREAAGQMLQKQIAKS